MSPERPGLNRQLPVTAPVPDETAAHLRGLTARELEVLALLSTGASAQAIADQLAITRPTVKRHLHNLYRKLGATNRVQATRCYLLAQSEPPAARRSQRGRPRR